MAILLFLAGTGQFGKNNTELKTRCSEPLSFRLGEIDERFSITDDELIALIQEAARVWSDAADTTVVLYDENGGIAINLVYAEVQQLSDREKQYRDRLEHEEFSITVLENEYRRMNRQYEEEVQKYDEDSRKLQQMINQTNEWVVQKNENGGFNDQDLKRYESRRDEIERRKRDLVQREIMLERKAGELNSKIDFLNEKIEKKNKLVEEYNRTFSGVRKFTQGAYEWTADRGSINIFHFLDKDELRLVIAHEMGHALGIGHVSNPESVMYELMGGQSRPGIKLTTEDIEALKATCKRLTTENSF